MGKRVCTPSQKVLMSQENASKAGNQQKKKGNQTIKEVVKVTNGTVTPGTAAHRTGIEVYHIRVELTQEEGAAHKQAEIASTQLRSTLRRKDNQVTEETLEKTIGTITVDKVESSHELNKNRSIWDNFDITKISNAGFKLELVEPEMHGEDAHRGGHTLPLPAKIVFKNKIGNLIKQKVQYDWRPTLCKFCKNSGHTVEKCKKKNKPQSELITKQLVVVSPAQVTEMTKDNSVEMNQERLKTVGNKEGTGKTEVLTSILEGRRRMGNSFAYQQAPG
ncbi:hypothetical protein MTR67_034791 [Solanum verrucosum]|uniref:DUF4283 domain-containing protein n=1 Tax=Solanum verrucosum TaxID=315347 RepID=A0AAF0U936_SOLVR|nr:hypothetical protein MTR67_034791 [Solanum verrucosum]